MHTTERQADTRALTDLNAAIRDEQVRLAYEHAPGAYSATLGCTLIAAMLLWREVPHAELITWASAATLLTLVRFYFVVQYRRAAPTGAQTDRWARLFVVGSLLAALIWSAGAFVLFVPDAAHYNAFIVVLIAGMLAGASFSLSVYWPAFQAFVFPVSVALLARLFSAVDLDTDYGMTMLGLGALTVLYVPLVYFYGRRTEANLVKLLESQLHNRELSQVLGIKFAELERSHRALAEENAARVKTEQVLRENENQLKLFELALTSTSSGVLFTDPRQRDNPVVYVNPAFTRMTGYSREETLGRSLRELVLGDEGDAVGEVRAAIREERPATLIVRSCRRNGSLFWNELNITPLRDAKGLVTHFVILQDDVTTQVDMEAALKQTRDELQGVLDNSPALVFTKDLEGRLLMVNRRWQEMFHLSADQVRGRRVHEVFPESFADGMQAADLKVIESGQPYQVEHSVPTERGLVTHLTVKFPLRDPHGRIYGICGMSTDITERKREQLLQGMHHSVSRLIAEAGSVQEVMRQVLPVLCETMPWDWGAVYLIDSNSGALRVCEYWSDARLKESDFQRYALSSEQGGPGLDFLGRACVAREPLWIANLGKVADTPGARVAKAAGINTAVAMPIFADSGVIGMVQFCSVEQRDPERMFLRIARSIGQQLGQFAKRREAEEQTRRAEARLELALEGSELALWDWNIATGDVYLSPRWAEMLGHPVAATYTTIDDLTALAHPDDHEPIRNAILGAFKGRPSSYAIVHRVRRAAGEWIWIESTGKVVERDEEGRAIRMAGTNADVTGRIAADEELRRARNELQAILDNSPAMIYAKGARGEIMVTNRAELTLIEQEASGHPAARGLHPHDREVLEAGAPLQTEELVVEEGSARTYIFTRFPMRRADGLVYGVCAIATDITDRKRMEAALGESEDRFRQFSESVNIGFWIVETRTGALLYSNPALQRILGLEERDLAGFESGKSALVHDDDREAMREAYDAWLQSPATSRFDFEYRLARPDGGMRWLREYAVKISDGDRGYRVFGITEDVTERKTGDEELRQTRAFLESVIEHLPNMVFVKDASELRFVKINRAGEELLGMSRDELVGKNDHDFFPPEQSEFFIDKDRETLARGEVLDIPEEVIETRRLGRRYLHTKKIPIPDAQGKPQYLLGISEDVTDRKLALEEIEEMNAALAKKASDLSASNDELEAFAYSVSHDLRAPLRHVNGFINLLRDHGGETLDAVSLRYLGKIQSASVRMSSLIDELLSFSRMSRIELSYTRIAMDRLVREIVAELKTQLGERRVEWVVGSLPALYGDRILLRQAFFNLLDNALKYTGRNPDAVIEIGCDSSGPDEATVFVKDNGVGFDMKYAHKLFGVFQRLHRQEEFPGTGIGLAHVRRILERHGGRVWAESEKGKGTVFFVVLPTGERSPA